jgi:hypothetical protein
LMASRATFALNTAPWFLLGLFVMVTALLSGG